MLIELRVPAIGESIREVEIGDWLKKEGDRVEKDQPIAILESEKATVELPAPAAGILGAILKAKGATAAVGETIGHITPGAEATAKPVSNDGAKPEKTVDGSGSKSSPAPLPSTPSRVMPAAERLLAETGIRAGEVTATGSGGRLLKEDVIRHQEKTPVLPAAETHTPELRASAPRPENRPEEIVRMSRLRRTIAERLVKAQQEAALLTTFNEIEMSAVIGLRKEHGDGFRERYGAKLGFMSFFVKAVIDGLKSTPSLNAEIRGTDIVYRNYFDIGVAIGGGKGLVVPVLRNAELMSFADIERAIADLSTRARENRLKIEELEGGTFTITNGGVYGSLLSTPIVNPPQSGVLGMHAILERPIAENGAVVIRPMMYIALTYDHRLVDGREAVTFLKRVKDVIENPARMLIEA